VGPKPNEMNKFFSIDLNLPAALGPVVHSASNRNSTISRKNQVSREQSAAGALGSQPCSHQCGVLNISQPYRPTRPVTGIALLFFFAFYRLLCKRKGDCSQKRYLL
jgi:hypothetical protein